MTRYFDFDINLTPHEKTGYVYVNISLAPQGYMSSGMFKTHTDARDFVSEQVSIMVERAYCENETL